MRFNLLPKKMKVTHILITLFSLVVACIASGANFSAKAGAIRTNTAISLDEGDEKYHVTVNVTEVNADGTETNLPSLGIIHSFGSPGKTGEIIKNDSLRIQLETDSKVGEKAVRCVVSVTMRDMAPILSEFTLTLP